MLTIAALTNFIGMLYNIRYKSFYITKNYCDILTDNDIRKCQYKRRIRLISHNNNIIIIMI